MNTNPTELLTQKEIEEIIHTFNSKLQYNLLSKANFTNAHDIRNIRDVSNDREVLQFKLKHYNDFSVEIELYYSEDDEYTSKGIFLSYKGVVILSVYIAYGSAELSYVAHNIQDIKDMLHAKTVVGRDISGVLDL
jgi:hypothetical protein